MADHILRAILRKSGVTHPGEERANLREMLQVQIAEIQAQHDRGRISRAVALDATRHVMDLAFQETVNNPAEYRAALQSGQLEAMRETIGGWDEDITPEAAAEKRRQAFAVTLGHRTDDFLQAGALTADDYAWTMQQLDPGSVADARARNGFNQVVGLDETPRDLDEQETQQVAATAWYERHGYLGERQSDYAPEEPAAEEHAGDWSESRMQKFVEQRERECEKSTDGPIPSDGVYHTPIND
jgi:hypothetical protein